jgi:mRNA interferase MazF
MRYLPMLRGDVVLCKLPMPSTLLTQFKPRPAVIVSKDTNNRRLDDLIVAPCTSNISRSQEPTHYLIDGTELARAGVVVPSVVRCEALMTLPKALVVRVVGRLSPGAMTAVAACLKDALAL